MEKVIAARVRPEEASMADVVRVAKAYGLVLGGLPPARRRRVVLWGARGDDVQLGSVEDRLLKRLSRPHASDHSWGGWHTHVHIGVGGRSLIRSVGGVSPVVADLIAMGLELDAIDPFGGA